MRRLALVSLGLAAACGVEVQGNPAPTDTFYKPTGVAFHDPWLVVSSSNFDLLYEGSRGGTVISVDPSQETPRLKGGVDIASFSGDLVVTDPACGPTPYALVASRYSNVLYQLALDGLTGSLACEPNVPCEVPLSGVGTVADPFALHAVCTADRKSAFVAYLRSGDGRGWVTEYELTGEHAMRSFAPVVGPVRSFAYDSVNDRLWMGVLATSIRPPLSWVDLGGNCQVDRAESDGGCSVGGVLVQQMPASLEIRGIAFANPDAFGQSTAVRRVYLAGRLYDVTAAATAGARTVDLGGLLVVADLVDNAIGGVDMQVVRTIPIGRGAGAIRVLPSRGTNMRDVVAALAGDDGELWLYDDDTLATTVFGRDATTGAPVLGHLPSSIAVGPKTTGPTGDVARIYVASFEDSFVTALEVPLSAPQDACVLTWGDPDGDGPLPRQEVCADVVGGAPRRIGPGVSK